MRDLYDTTERAMLPYILLGDAARQLHDGVDGYNENNLKIDKLEWGINKKNLTKEVLSLFVTWGFEDWEDKGYKYMAGTVPVFVHVFERKYRFFDMPDMRYYVADIFKIPNEFEKYWKARFIVK